MKTIEKIEHDYKAAFKDRDTIRVGVLRMIRAAFANKAIEKRGEVTDTEALQVLKSEVKKRKESIESFKQGGREELAAGEEAELDILKKYLPEELSEGEIREIIAAVVADLPESDRTNFGKVMGAAVAKVAGRADGQLVSRLVKENLG